MGAWLHLPGVVGLSLALLAACAGRPTGVLEPVAAVPSAAQVEMLVTTTRDRAETPGEMFSGERAPSPTFADITVSIPPGTVRKAGEVAWPRKLPPNPATDFATLKAEEIERIAAEKWLSSHVRKSPDASVLVFIHGFNNHFEDAVFRFAQIMHDSGAHSVPVLATWPSRGSLLAYGYDRESTNYTRNAVERLFQYLARDSEVKEVSILAHSMGNWLALESLRQMAIRNDGLPAKFKNVMLAAPDVDVDVFRSQIADMGKRRPRFTLFVSRDDRALAVSRRVWGNVSRLGAIDPEQSPYKEELSANNISVIDLTKIKEGDSLHHTKFAESPEIVQLIGNRLSDGQTLTDSRLGLGDHIVAATAGAAQTVGTAAGLVVSAPAAIVDQNTRQNYAHHIEALVGPANGANMAGSECGKRSRATSGCSQ
ncbi:MULTISPECIES: alpha/beta hydrolase [unclassified Sinorhizobium]|uniref:alpha/beta hydrolase n=1 Tax=unclassified Sinorhizobium TaxID=2613772 RepID=UPI0024C360B8|nr:MULTISPECIES: alpha/beta hydrolase [unclassified Sinorhizobium]MDK1373683.1 alpha/beta hydrolase [Sinorhizobium sp. 6-70]MDK1477755.1 alpha/beta hydrolase [Sinorhizobium sp. 6-117]